MNNYVFFLDGVGDYSVVQKINRIKVPNKYFPILSRSLKNFGFKVKYIDARSNTFTKEHLIKIISEQKPLSILINTNFDNIQHIARLNLKKVIDDIKVILFSDNFDINWLSNIGDLRIDNFIIREDSIHFNDFIVQILEHLIPVKKEFSDISHLSVDKLVSDWTFIENLSNYNPELNIASGCLRKCSFCSIANTDVRFRDIDLVMDEIEYLLHNGIQYFHIANHSFSTDLSYMEKFCKKIISKFNDKDFVWSCFGLPEYLYKEKTILKLLKKSKLGRLEISIESGSKDMLQQYDLKINREIITEFVKSTIENDITSILGHLIIGGPQENEYSINETLEFVKQLVRIAPGYIEFNTSFLHPDIGSKLYNSSYFRERSLETFIPKGVRKLHCMYETDKLEYVGLIKSKQQLNKEISKLLRESVSKINQKNRLTQVEYYKKGLCTQYFFYFLSRSSTSGLQQLKSKNRFLKFSWEIASEIDNYSPFLLGRVVKKDEEDILIFDPILSNKDSPPYLVINGDEHKMIQLADGRKTFKEIVKNLYNLTNGYHNNISMNLLNFYSKLESLDLLLFTKILN